MTDTNKLREALLLLRNHTSINSHQIEIIDEALAASKPEPQAQAVEPEVVAYIQSDKEGADLIWDWDYDEELDGNLYSYEPLITLQSHREEMADVLRHKEDWKSVATSLQEQRNNLAEAIAKKDAALKALKVAAFRCASVIRTRQQKLDNELTSSDVTDAVYALDGVEAAITQAQEQLK